MSQKLNVRTLVITGLLLTVGLITCGIISFGGLSAEKNIMQNKAEFKADDFTIETELTDTDFMPNDSLMVEPAAGGKNVKYIQLFEELEADN